MKKIGTVMLSVILLLFLCAPAAYAAAMKTYTLDELDMSIGIPENWAVFTRDTPANDPNFAVLGLNGETMLSYYKQNYIFLNALMTSNPYTEIVVTMFDNMGMKDLSEYSDAEKSAFAEQSMGANAKNLGAVYDGYDLYTSNGIDYLVFSFSRSDATAKLTDNACQYYTIVNNRAVNITMHSYKGDITEANASLLKDVVDSAAFLAAATPTPSPAPTIKPTPSPRPSATQKAPSASSKPKATASAAPPVAGSTSGGSDNTAAIIICVAAGIIIIGIAVIVIYFIRKRDPKRTTPGTGNWTPPPPAYTQYNQPGGSNPAPQIFCSHCGAAVPPETQFCPRCGDRIY